MFLYMMCFVIHMMYIGPAPPPCTSLEDLMEENRWIYRVAGNILEEEETSMTDHFCDIKFW